MKTTRNWTDLVGIEPALDDAKAAAIADLQRAGTTVNGWRTIHAHLQGLVGPSAAQPELRSMAAFRTAYRHILAAVQNGGQLPRDTAFRGDGVERMIPHGSQVRTA